MCLPSSKGLLDGGDVLRAFREVLHYLQADFRVRNLPPAKADGHLDLVPRA